MFKRKHVKELKEEKKVRKQDQLDQIRSVGLKTEASRDDGSWMEVGRGELSGR